MNTEKLNRYVSAGQWYRNLQQTTNDAFFPLYRNTDRHLLLCGGAGSGKSIFAGRKVLERIDGEAGHRILVCRKIARTLRESCFRQLSGQIKEHYDVRDFKINRTDMLITNLKNGSSILFAGLDDAEKLKSVYRVTGIWIEEGSEISEADYNQLDLRLRGRTESYKQIITTFNPVDINHWLKWRFFDQPLPNVTAHRSTYRDNRFLDEEQTQVLEALKDSDPYYYRVYCLGEWGVFGHTVFDTSRVAEQLSVATEPSETGSFSYDDDGLTLQNIRWIPSESGSIRLYQLPRKGRPYVIGGDTAGEGSDRFAAQVLDNITGQQVAVLHSGYDEDLYAKQMYCLGMYYNEALIGIEANFSTYPIRELERLGYPKQYVRETEDNFTHRRTYAYGFKTTMLTRPVILGNLIRVVRESAETVCDRATLEEMQTFVRNEKGRPEAQSGAHDDLIMALAIAHYIREQQDTAVSAEPKPKVYYLACEIPNEDSLGYGETVHVI